MSKTPKKEDGLLGMAFDEALARLVQTKPEEIQDAYDQALREEAEAKRYVEERRTSIRQGARRATKRFRI